MSLVKPAIFHVRARKAIQEFPHAVRGTLGQAIWDLQRGMKLSMPLSRPMTAVSPGVEELRIRDSDGIFRVFYYTQSSFGVLVFHAFAKKTQKTPPAEIATGRRRYQELIREIQSSRNT
jgi:phage-related protein